LLKEFLSYVFKQQAEEDSKNRCYNNRPYDDDICWKGLSELSILILKEDKEFYKHNGHCKPACSTESLLQAKEKQQQQK